MVVKTAKRSVYSSSHKGRRNGLALSFDADRGGGKRRAGYYPNSLIAAKCNAVGFFKPLFANSMIFSATSWVMASSRLLNPSASHVITNAFATA